MAEILNMISDVDLLQVYQDGYNYSHLTAVRAVYSVGVDAGLAQALAQAVVDALAPTPAPDITPDPAES
jgi:hypothetical protein